MKSKHNDIWVAVITQAVTAGDCLEGTRTSMCVPAFLEIDQTTRNGP